MKIQSDYVEEKKEESEPLVRNRRANFIKALSILKEDEREDQSDISVFYNEDENDKSLLKRLGCAPKSNSENED